MAKPWSTLTPNSSLLYLTHQSNEMTPGTFPFSFFCSRYSLYLKVLESFFPHVSSHTWWNLIHHPSKGYLEHHHLHMALLPGGILTLSDFLLPMLCTSLEFDGWIICIFALSPQLDSVLPTMIDKVLRYMENVPGMDSMSLLNWWHSRSDNTLGHNDIPKISSLKHGKGLDMDLRCHSDLSFEI